jgi:hypothetical protein
VDVEGCPCAPEEAGGKFTTQGGGLFEPITTRLWKAKNPDEQRYDVPPKQKETLWRELKDIFTLSEGVD